MAHEDPLIADAIATLEAEDAGVARDAEAAIEWLTAGEGLEVLTQERLQTFLWYGLPMKWLTDTDHHRRVAAALGRAFDLLGLPRYAELCRSATTAGVLDTYERSDAEGKKAFHRADVASGIRPPDVTELEWSSVMGMTESDALSSTAELLELAVTGGDLVPGARGWKQRQADLVRAHLTTARLELGGRTWLDAITGERLDPWLSTHRSPTRRRILESLAAGLRAPAEPPAGIEDPIPRLRWLLGELAEGQPLTQTGNLSRAFVQAAAARFGWDLRNPPRTEDELYDLHQLRHLAQRLGLARRTARKLALTPKGRAALADVELLWRRTAQGLLPDHQFATALGEIAVAQLVHREMHAHELDATLTDVVAEVGWRATGTGLPPDERDISSAWHQTTNLLRALDRLAAGGGWQDRSYALTPAGRAVALECLHRRATGPRSSPGADVANRRPPIFGPEPWAERAGAGWSHWDLWFCLVCLIETESDWAALEEEIIAWDRRRSVASRTWERKRNHLLDLRARLDAAGLFAADLATDALDDKALRTKARRTVLHQELAGRDLTPAMEDTPRPDCASAPCGALAGVPGIADRGPTGCSPIWPMPSTGASGWPRSWRPPQPGRSRSERPRSTAGPVAGGAHRRARSLPPRAA